MQSHALITAYIQALSLQSSQHSSNSILQDITAQGRMSIGEKGTPCEENNVVLPDLQLDLPNECT